MPSRSLCSSGICYYPLNQGGTVIAQALSGMEDIRPEPKETLGEKLLEGNGRSNDLECRCFFDELPQPLHIRRAACTARIVGPAVDILLSPAIVHRAEIRDCI